MFNVLRFSFLAVAVFGSCVSVRAQGDAVRGKKALLERAFVPAVHNFLDIIRETLPVVPILLISPIICPFHEVNPGPTLIGPTGLYSEPRAHILNFGALNLPRIRTLHYGCFSLTYLAPRFIRKEAQWVRKSTAC